MKKRPALMTFFAGILAGVLAAFLFQVIFSISISSKGLTSTPRRFGDVTFWTIQDKSAEVFSQKLAKTLAQVHGQQFVMIKRKIPFLRLYKTPAGQVEYLALFNRSKEKPFLLMEWDKHTGLASALWLFNEDKVNAILLTDFSHSGKLSNAVYTRINEKGKPEGGTLVDINFDGSFDVLKVFGKDGKGSITGIFIGEGWQKVDYYSHKNLSAASGKTIYSFDINSGWQKIKKK